MAPKSEGSSKRVMNKGAWTTEEDRRLAQYIEIHGAKKWKTVAMKAGVLSSLSSSSSSSPLVTSVDTKRGHL
jgi:hypothetical protein